MKGVLSMQQTQTSPRRHWKRRALSLLMAAVMVLGLCPAFPGTQASAAHWADPYLSQLVEWGVISTAQAQNPDRALTRADFMGIVNRAYGYHEIGEMPFEDVAVTDWYYDDVGIAYNAQYIKGTSPTTASPKDPLTRETATTILGRNMMLQDSAGEILDFTDARRISTWAQGTIKSSLEHYLVSGYDDGTFRPQRNVSWGEMASMVTRLIGTPLQEPGDYSLGGTFGNVTITSPGVTLRDTVVSGDLYITGGVGLGDVKLENVTVLGRIIASGTGSSEGGGASILLRNVTADELLVDNLQGKEVSVRADGITEIGSTTVRTSAYIEDNTPEGLGLHMISLEGESYPEGEEPEGWEPPKLTLAGRIEEVVNRTPGSTVHAAAGTIAKLTVDEAAEGSAVIIDRNTVVKELNLDTATTVTGEGDIDKLVVNAPGCVVEMLPDEIVIRPGITAEINGEIMDSVAAQESSLEPLILAGYPQAQDITPTGLDAAFMTNKSGTVYWAVSPITEGSVGEEELIKPPSYGSIAVARGSVKAPKGNEEFISKIAGLTPGGSYYLSAVLVDARDKRSPTKVISFATPDNTVPAFCAGYPHMSKVSPKDSVAVVMPTKDCKLYYALLPQGAVAPKIEEMKTNAVAGTLGYGVRDVYKNTEDAFRVNDVTLAEKTTYVLYFFLTDGVNNSAVTSLTFTTDDETPPEFIIDPHVVDVKANSVGLSFRLNEDGIVYWVAVPAGTVYPKPEPGTDEQTAPLTSDYAKLQVASGMNIGAEGKAGRVNAKANADGTISVSGLKPETAYDFYYVAKDNAGPDRNYSLTVKKITINTLDETGPKFKQSFSRVSGTDKTKDPMSDTAIYIDVSENIAYAGQGGGTDLLELYQQTRTGSEADRNAAINKLASNLFGNAQDENMGIKLFKVNMQNNAPTRVPSKWSTSQTTEDWVIDYTKATVTSLPSGGIRITFPSEGLHLENGAKYFFTIGEYRDISNKQNMVSPNPVDFFRNESASLAGQHDVKPFIVEFPWVDLSSPGVDPGAEPVSDGKAVRVDMSFLMAPSSTETASDSYSYDVLLWAFNQVEYDLYYRVVDLNGNQISTVSEDGTSSYPSVYNYSNPSDPTDKAEVKNYLIFPETETNKADKNGWFNLGKSSNVDGAEKSASGRSAIKHFNNKGASIVFPKLNKLSSKLNYEFAIHLTKIRDVPEFQNGKDTWKNWNEQVIFHINVGAGRSNLLDSISNEKTAVYNTWTTLEKQGLSNNGIKSIGRNYNEKPAPDTLEISWPFTDSSLPNFTGVQIKKEDLGPNSVKVQFNMNTAGTVYWAVGMADSGPNNIPEVITTRRADVKSEASIDQQDVNNGGLLAYAGTGDAYWIRLTDVEKNGRRSLAPPDITKGESMQPWMAGTLASPPEGPLDESDKPDRNSKDDPELYNLILAPDPLWVRNPTGENEINHGEKYTEGRKTDFFEIDNLSADTNYFLYVVVKGSSDDPSHVYIYQFKTAKGTPIISLGRYAQSDSVGGATIGTDIDSNLNYIVFSLENAKMIKLLRSPFTVGTTYGLKNTTTGAFSLPKNYKPELGIVDDAGNEVYTVLDALVHRYSHTKVANSEVGSDEQLVLPGGTYDGASVFDIFASDDLKIELSGALHGEFLSDFLGGIQEKVPLTSKTLKGTKNGGQIINEQLAIDKGTNYIILAVAQSPNKGDKENYEVDAYAAYTPIRIGSAKAPETGRDLWAVSMSGTATDTSYRGTISITFDTPLYAQTGGRMPLDGNIFKTLGTWTPSGLSNRLAVDVTSTGMNSTITLSNLSETLGWQNGDFILIPAGSMFNGDSDPTQKNLSIRVTKVTSGINVQIQWGSEVYNEIFPFEQPQDITAYIEVPNNPNWILEGDPEGTQTLYIDEANNQTVKFTSSVAPPQYAASSSYNWSSSRDSVLALNTADQKNKDASFTVKGTGEALITLDIITSLPTGIKTTRKQLRVIVGNTVTFTSVKGDGNSAAISDADPNSVSVKVSPDNPNPTVTFTFTSVRPLASTGLDGAFSPSDAFSAPTTSLSADGKTITVSAKVMKLNNPIVTLTLKSGTTTLSTVTVGLSGSQSTMQIPSNPNPFGN